MAIPIGKPGRAWTRQNVPTVGGPGPFAPPLLAAVHVPDGVPDGCSCTWTWLARARALARKYANGSPPSRHAGAWEVPGWP
jgi:hypothetical protein